MTGTVHWFLTRNRGDETARRALVTILEDRQVADPSESALLSEAALAEDWDRPEEDEAWSHLQRAQ